jgi:hypothetical protein
VSGLRAVMAVFRALNAISRMPPHVHGSECYQNAGVARILAEQAAGKCQLAGMSPKAVLAAGAAAALLITGCASAAPAARVHAEVSKLGYAPHSAIQSRAQIVAAKAFCKMMTTGTSYRAAVGDAVQAFGSNAKATAFIDTAISAYCPGVKR